MALDLTNAQVVAERTIGSLGPCAVVRRPADKSPEQWEGHELLVLRQLSREQDENEESVRQLREDAEALKGLSHPNLLRVVGVVPHKDNEFVAIEWVEADELSVLVSRRQLPVGRALSVAQQCAAGLGALASARRYHRDLRSTGVLVTPDGTVRMVPVACPPDFKVEHRAARVAFYRGLPTYAAPELHPAGGVSPTERSNIFAFGVMFYEMLTSQSPFRGGTPTRMLVDIQNATPSPASALVKELPAEIDRICSRCLEKDPERRYPTFSAIEASLRIAAETAAYQVSKPPTRQMPAAKSTRRTSAARSGVGRRHLAAIIALILAAVAVAAIVLVALSRPEPGETQEKTESQLGNQALVQADALLQSGRYEQAIRFLDAHRMNRDVDPPRFDYLYRRANLQHWLSRAQRAEGRGRWSEAAQALEQAESFQDPSERSQLSVRRDSVGYRACVDRARTLENSADWDGLVKCIEQALDLARKLSLSSQEIEKHEVSLRFAAAMLESLNARRAGKSDEERNALFAAARVMPTHAAVLARLSELKAGPAAAEETIARAGEALRAGRRDEAVKLARDAAACWPLDDRPQQIATFVSDWEACNRAGMALASEKFPGATWTEADRKGAFCVDRYEYPGGEGQVPRTLVSAVEAASLCQKRGSRLCSLAEWQLACSGPDGLAYPYGEEYRPDACRTETNGPGQAGQMGVCRSVFGVFDMSGNVAEWTSDSIPMGQMVAGGDWSGGSAQTRCMSASPFTSELVSARVGFRCCRSLPPNESR